MKVLIQKKYQNHIPGSFAYRLICVDDKFNKSVVVFRGKNAAYKFIEAILNEYEYCKKVIKKHFNKNLIMSWIYKKLIDDDDEKVRDHCHVTGKFIRAAHWSC